MRFFPAAALLILSCFVTLGAAFAGAPGSCYGNSTDPTVCQFWLESYTRAPLVAESFGLRLDDGVHNVLSLSYKDTLGPRFISNTSRADLFVPQRTADEFKSFLEARLSGIEISHAVEPITYVAKPTYSCFSPWASSPAPAGALEKPEYKPIKVPVIEKSNSADIPYILESHTKMTDAQSEDPSSLHLTIGQTTPGGPLDFIHTNDNGDTFIESQQVTFSATQLKQTVTLPCTSVRGRPCTPQVEVKIVPNRYTWDTASAEVSKKIYKRKADGTYEEVNNCVSQGCLVSWTTKFGWSYTPKDRCGGDAWANCNGDEIDFGQAHTLPSYGSQEGASASSIRCVHTQVRGAMGPGVAHILYPATGRRGMVPCL